MLKKDYERVKMHEAWRRGNLISKNHFNAKTFSKMMEQARGGKLRNTSQDLSLATQVFFMKKTFCKARNIMT